ncbi:MAG: flagellar basal body rod protein FlgB [Verrucomicrobiia bacterium]
MIGELVMISGLFNNINYQAAVKMLDATVMRHNAIASNIANVETPNYKRIDLAPDFVKELQNAVISGKSEQIEKLKPQIVQDSSAVPRRLDGNTVQLESELVKLNQNNMEHTLETQLINSSLLKLRLAITGRVT